MGNMEKKQKSPWRFFFAAIAALGVWELTGGAVVGLLLRTGILTHGKASTIGVIGGADGPTAIFVTHSAPEWYQIVIPAAMVAVGIWGYLRLRKTGEKE